MELSDDLIIKPKNKNHVVLEVPALFRCILFFINHKKEFTSVEFTLPPGIYPNPKWLEKAIDDAYRNSLKTLKLSTKELSWRKGSTHEFITATAGNGHEISVDREWKPAYSTVLAFEQLPEPPDSLEEEKTLDHHSV